MTKGELRRVIHEIQRERLSDMAAVHDALPLLEHSHLKEASTVLLYHSLKDEINTRPLLESGCAGKLILLPVVVGDTLELRQYTGETRLGSFGIEEPIGHVFSDFSQIDLVVVPGLAFTLAGHRLGRGRGYYDKLLPKLENAYRLGLCYSWQIMSDIPTEEHDIMMHEVLGL